MKTLLRAAGWLAVVVVVLALAGYAWAHVASQRELDTIHPFTAVPVVLPADAASLEEGRRLATIRGCNGCHGPRGEGRVLFDDPKIARIVAPNLTLAARKYSDAELAGMLKQGVRPDGRSMVVMPSQLYRHLTDADLARILAWLKGLPAVEGLGPDFSPGPLGRVGIAAGKLKVIAREISEGRDAPAAPAGTPLARGRYLAITVCAECHGTDLAGKTTPAYVAPDLRSVRAYSAEAFTALVRKGVAVGGRELPFMGPISRDHLSRLDDAEIADLHAYLKAP